MEVPGDRSPRLSKCDFGFCGVLLAALVEDITEEEKKMSGSGRTRGVHGSRAENLTNPSGTVVSLRPNKMSKLAVLLEIRGGSCNESNRMLSCISFEMIWVM